MTDGAGSASANFAVTEFSPVAVVEAGPQGLDAGLLLQLRRTLASLNAGTALEVRSPRADLRADLAAWCRLNGHELIAALDAGDHTRFCIRKGHAAAAQAQPDWGIRLPQQPGGGPSLRDWLARQGGT